MKEPNVRYRFAGYIHGLPVYDIVDEQKTKAKYLKQTNEPILGTRGDKHDERE